MRRARRAAARACARVRCGNTFTIARASWRARGASARDGKGVSSVRGVVLCFRVTLIVIRRRGERGGRGWRRCARW